MNVAAYCRVSTSKTDQLNSLEAQKEFFAEYVKTTGDTLVRLYADEGLSGTKTKNRKEFLQLMKDAETGLFQQVVTKDISRFSRNTVDLLQSVRHLNSLGIPTLFINSRMTSMGESELLLSVFGAVAQEESSNTSKRIKFGKKLNAEQGRVPNIVYGYDKTIGDYFNLSINEQEADTIRQIFAWYVLDAYGSYKIASMLNAQGIRTKRGYQWSQNAVCRVLTNELYVGKIINRKQETLDFLTGTRTDRDEEDWVIKERPDLAIVDSEIFERAKEIMKARGQAFQVDKERHSNQHLFSTLIKCKECGWSFRRTVRTYKNTYTRWVCSCHNLKGADGCSNAIAVDEDELIATLENYFVQTLKTKKNVSNYVVGEFNRIYKAKNKNILYEKELRAKLTRLQNTRQKYMDMYTDDLISRETLNEKLAGTRQEVAHLENELKMAALHITKADQLESIFKTTFSTIEQIVSVGEMTNAQLRQLIHKIEVDSEGHVEIFLRLLGDMALDETVLVYDNYT